MNDRVLNEICSKGNLGGYRETLKIILEGILNANCCLSISDISNRSSIEQLKNKSSHIRIGLKNKRSNNLSVIWDILHEYGHHLSGFPTYKQPKINREKKAWNYAEIELKKHTKLIEKFGDFKEYKKCCLKTYKTCT